MVLSLDELQKDIIDLRVEIASLSTAFNNHASYTEASLIKTEALMDKRLTGMNEFRQALNDQTRNYVLSNVCLATHKAVDDKITSLQKTVWIGIGIFVTLQIAVGVILHFI